MNARLGFEDLYFHDEGALGRKNIHTNVSDFLMRQNTRVHQTNTSRYLLDFSYDLFAPPL